jgi:hypothetical protein
MMKKRLVGLIAIACLSTIALADQSTDRSVCTGSQWAIDCNKGSLADLQSSGSAHLTGTRVLGDTNISGHLTTDSATLNSLNTSGKTELTNTTILGDAQISGALMAKGSAFNTVNVSGGTQLFTSKVQGALQVSGKLQATKTQFNDAVDVSGSMVCTHCTFAKLVTVSGGLKATHSVFKGDVSISGSKVYFSSSELNNIVIEKNNDLQPQQIILDNHSMVHGDISFVSGNGSVILTGTSKIEGKVIGAKVTTSV